MRVQPLQAPDPVVGEIAQMARVKPVRPADSGEIVLQLANIAVVVINVRVANLKQPDRAGSLDLNVNQLGPGFVGV